MIYSKITTHLDKDEFSAAYNSSVPYLEDGNYGYPTRKGESGVEVSIAGSEYQNLKDLLFVQFNTVVQSFTTINNTMIVFELREVGTDHLLALKLGTLVDGTFNTWVSLFNPDSGGTLSWVFNPPSDPEVIELMSHTGIKRVLMKPSGKNLEDFIIAIGSVRVNDSDTGVHQYKSTWGWDNYETDLVDM